MFIRSHYRYLALAHVLSGLGVLGLMACASPPDVATEASGTRARPCESASESPDPYLWLEEIRSPGALAWVEKHNQTSLRSLQNDSRFESLLSDARQAAQSPDRLPLGELQGGYYYNLWQDRARVRGLWRRATLPSYQSARPEWETLLDVDALNQREQANWVFKGFECAPSGIRCMVSLSDGGSDATTFREFDLQTKTFVRDGFVLPTAKSSVVWEDDDHLVVATDWADGQALSSTGYPAVVKRWARGTPMGAASRVFQGSKGLVGLFVRTLVDVDGTRQTVIAEYLDYYSVRVWMVQAKGVSSVTIPAKSRVQALHHGQLVFILKEDWTLGTSRYVAGSIVSLPLADATATEPRVSLVYAPAQRQSIEAVAPTSTGLLVSGYDNIRGRLWLFRYTNAQWRQSSIAVPDNGAIRLAGSSSTQPVAFVVYQGFLAPDTQYALNANTEAMVPIRALAHLFDTDGLVAEQREVLRNDGVRVPYFVVRRADIPLDGSTPTLMEGYGGFQISLSPEYDALTGKLWLERGGAFVVANIRGGGEFGPSWHQAALKTNRQVAYDDFVAVAQDLIRNGYTSPRRLGILGGSNGGLLVGVMLTQHPELFRAVISRAPLLDMLRFVDMGAGEWWTAEYGDPRVPSERAFLESISPYHNLRKWAGQASVVPKPLFLTTRGDDRTHPGHPRKFAALMEELHMPFLFYESDDGGHGAADPEQLAFRRTLEFTYLHQRLVDSAGSVTVP